MDSAPNEKPVNTSIALFKFSGLAAPSNKVYNTMNKPPKPNTAKPATPKPITEPPVKDTFSACFKLVRAACVVLTFAKVATFIPT